MTDILLKVVPIVLTAVGLFFTIYIAFRKKSFANSKIRISIPYTSHQPIQNRKDKRGPIIFYIFDLEKNENPIICVPIQISNDSSVACTDLIIRVANPLENSIASTYFYQKDKSKTTITNVKGRMSDNEIEFRELGDIAQIEYKIDKLRIGETHAIMHFMRANKTSTKVSSHETLDNSDSVYSSRYSAIKKVLSCLNLYIGVFSPDFKAVESNLDIISLNCISEKEVANVIDDMLDASWDNKRPAPGFYFGDPISSILSPNDQKLKNINRQTIVECVFSELTLSDVINTSPNEKIKKIKYPKVRTMEFMSPPWGFFGERFDLSNIVSLILKKSK